MALAEASRTPRSERRPSLHSSHDPRAERTRQSIFAAIRTLMSRRATPVSVGDVVRTAGISRSSFYAHFSSLDEVASELVRAQFGGIGASGPGFDRGEVPGGAARAEYALLVEHLVENFALYSGALELPLTRSAYDDIVEGYADRLLESVVLLDRLPVGVNPRLTAIHIAGGAVTVISAWLRGQLDVTDRELVDQLVRLLPSWLIDPAG